jgi:hypothetical protein
MWCAFPYLRKIFDKNKKRMDDKLLQTMCTYIHFGDKGLIQTHGHIKLILQLTLDLLAMESDNEDLTLGCS